MKKILVTGFMLAMPAGLNAQLTDAEIKAWHDSFNNPEQQEISMETMPQSGLPPSGNPVIAYADVSKLPGTVILLGENTIPMEFTRNETSSPTIISNFFWGNMKKFETTQPSTMPDSSCVIYMDNGDYVRGLKKWIVEKAYGCGPDLATVLVEIDDRDKEKFAASKSPYFVARCPDYEVPADTTKKTRIGLDRDYAVSPKQKLQAETAIQGYFKGIWPTVFTEIKREMNIENICEVVPDPEELAKVRQQQNTFLEMTPAGALNAISMNWSFQPLIINAKSKTPALLASVQWSKEGLCLYQANLVIEMSTQNPFVVKEIFSRESVLDGSPVCADCKKCSTMNGTFHGVFDSNSDGLGELLFEWVGYESQGYTLYEYSNDKFNEVAGYGEGC